MEMGRYKNIWNFKRSNFNNWIFYINQRIYCIIIILSSNKEFIKILLLNIDHIIKKKLSTESLQSGEIIKKLYQKSNEKKEISDKIKKKDVKKGLSSHGLPKRSPTLVLTMPETT